MKPVAAFWLVRDREAGAFCFAHVTRLQQASTLGDRLAQGLGMLKLQVDRKDMESADGLDGLLVTSISANFLDAIKDARLLLIIPNAAHRERHIGAAARVLHLAPGRFERWECP